MKTRISALISKAAILLMITIASILMPFNIYADTLPQSEIVGVTYNKIDQDVTYVNSSGTYTYIYEIEVLLKNKYVGVVDGTLSYSYSEVPNSQTVTSSKRTYVNGDSFKLNVSIVQFGSSYSGSAPMYSASFLVNSQNTNVTKYEDLTSIDSIVSLLQDIYTNSGDIENLSTNQLTELEKIVQNTSLANEYLDVLTKIKKWDFPLESFTAIYTSFINNYDLIQFQTYNDYTFPLFSYSQGDILNTISYNSLSQFDCKYIIAIQCNEQIWNANLLSKYVSGTNIEYSNFNQLFYTYVYPNKHFQIVSVDTHYSGSGSINISLAANLDFIGVPIYYDRLNKTNLGTDFCLNFGLTNRLLNNLEIIANGTSQSNQQSQDLSSGTDSMQDQMDDLVGIEDSYNQQFNNSVDSIDFSNPLQQNQGLLGASNFVITVFNGLIANNPFSILIIIVCILLIGKKVIGK